MYTYHYTLVQCFKVAVIWLLNKLEFKCCYGYQVDTERYYISYLQTTTWLAVLRIILVVILIKANLIKLSNKWKISSYMFWETFRLDFITNILVGATQQTITKIQSLEYFTTLKNITPDLSAYKCPDTKSYLI